MNGINFLKIILLTLLAVCSFGRDYYISFDWVVKNGRLSVENFNCSNSLIKTNAPKRLLFIFPLTKDIYTTCMKNKEKIVSKLLKEKIVVTSNEKISNGRVYAKSKLVCLPKRFDIIIKDKKVYFYLKEED